VDNLPVGTIPVDAIFTPTEGELSYRAGTCRQRSHAGKVIFEVWTDGTIEAADALSQSARMLEELLAPFAGFGKVVEAVPEKVVSESSIPQELFNMPVEQLNLSVRTMIACGAVTSDRW